MAKLTAHVDLAKTDNGAILLNSRTGAYWEVNDTGRHIIEALIESGSREAAAQAIVEKFDVSLEQAEADIKKIVEELSEAGLLTE
ncbi:lasso peptide biosynthesis PqqD family chaperone [Nocardia sp. NPDC056541]|uniref:lasso peptide biosynthesis PqqD family chaperone n=1 Tax=Nocardia sp. NPDC056541 TaxID=3345860 RepID=UPI00366BD9C7